jgi:hypothetical protein
MSGWGEGRGKAEGALRAGPCGGKQAEAPRPGMAFPWCREGWRPQLAATPARLPQHIQPVGPYGQRDSGGAVCGGGLVHAQRPEPGGRLHQQRHEGLGVAAAQGGDQGGPAKGQGVGQGRQACVCRRERTGQGVRPARPAPSSLCGSQHAARVQLHRLVQHIQAACGVAGPAAAAARGTDWTPRACTVSGWQLKADQRRAAPRRRPPRSIHSCMSARLARRPSKSARAASRSRAPSSRTSTDTRRAKSRAWRRAPSNSLVYCLQARERACAACVYVGQG